MTTVRTYHPIIDTQSRRSWLNLAAYDEIGIAPHEANSAKRTVDLFRAGHPTRSMTVDGVEGDKLEAALMALRVRPRRMPDNQPE